MNWYCPIYGRRETRERDAVSERFVAPGILFLCSSFRTADGVFAARLLRVIVRACVATGTTFLGLLQRVTGDLPAGQELVGGCRR